MVSTFFYREAGAEHSPVLLFAARIPEFSLISNSSARLADRFRLIARISLHSGFYRVSGGAPLLVYLCKSFARRSRCSQTALGLKHTGMYVF